VTSEPNGHATQRPGSARWLLRVTELLWENSEITSSLVRRLALPDGDAQAMLQSLSEHQLAIAALIGEMSRKRDAWAPR
jgi:hypothetical protein